MAKRGYTGLKRIVFAARYSAQGIVAAWRFESAFRQEVVLAVIAIPLGLWLGDDGIERALLVGSIILVLVVELLNSAIECTVDRIGDGVHPLSERSKDMSSAAVLISLVLAAGVWLLVLFG